MNFTINYFLGNQRLGSTKMNHNYHLGSRAFFCNKCGEIWGRIYVEPSTYWRVENRFCPTHKNDPEAGWDTYAGMFRSNFGINYHENSPEINLVKCLPKEVLLHDFLIATSEKPNGTTQ